MSEPADFDVVVIGAGGAGMMCAIHAGRRGRRVLLLDHTEKIGRKILISGGGRCNFTNIHATAANYLSKNPHFAKSALSRYTPSDFIAMVKDHQIPFHEKKLGQLFCDGPAQAIVDMLVTECEKSGCSFSLGATVRGLRKTDKRFLVDTANGTITAESVVVSTGGLSIPKIGATGLGYELAKSFGLNIVAPFPALVGFNWSAEDLKAYGGLAGVSVEAEVKAGKSAFAENILFTHRGLSGPAILQSSLYWSPGDNLEINLAPDGDLDQWLLDEKRAGCIKELKNLLAEGFPRSLAEQICQLWLPSRPIRDITDENLRQLGQKLNRWLVTPACNTGFDKAEVTRGGVDTAELSSQSMESKKVPGLFFIGEVVDVTGQLGGYNFQWAWSSAYAAAQYV